MENELKAEGESSGGMGEPQDTFAATQFDPFESGQENISKFAQNFSIARREYYLLGLLIGR